MKKPFLLITGLLLALLIFQFPSQSKSDLPYPKIESSKDRPPVCQQEFLNEMHVMRKGWEANLVALTDQEKPASEMVDEAFEGVRTYRCWLEYLCRTVQYSGTADSVESSLGILTDHVGTIPGCTDPEDIEIPETELRFLPQCHVKTEGNTRVNTINNNFKSCMAYLELEFGTLNPDADEAFTSHLDSVQNRSHVFVTLEKQLQRTHARQKAGALESKLVKILSKMHGMENAIQTLKNQFNQLDDRVPCTIQECS